MTINSWSVFGVGKVSVGSDISGIFDQDLRIASICGVFLIILIRYLHLHKCLCVSPDQKNSWIVKTYLTSYVIMRYNELVQEQVR